MTKKSIVDVGSFELAPMEVGIDEVMDLVAANVGSDGLDAFDLERAINPGAGGTQWKVPGIDGEPEMLSEITGVILYHRLVRAYWGEEFKPGSPPLCSSIDAMWGEGEPGGSCEECPLAVFGSGPNNSQACRAVKQLFMLREGELLPMTVNITASSIGAPKRYLLSLLSKRRLRYNQVVTKIELTPAKSTSGFDYAAAGFSLASVLTQPQQVAMAAMTGIFEPLLSKQPITVDVEAEEIPDPRDAQSKPPYGGDQQAEPDF